MDMYCLKSGVNQSDEEQNAHLEKLRDPIVPGSETQSGGTSDGTAEQRLELQAALELLASGTVESICFRSPNVLARSEEELATLKSFLSENEIGLTLAVSDIGPNSADSGYEPEGADTEDIVEVESS